MRHGRAIATLVLFVARVLASDPGSGFPPPATKADASSSTSHEKAPSAVSIGANVPSKK